ncbi:E3 ubiquitin-protein ligase RNF4-like isoform X1 [Centruroides sculpturatus]|uniref:E3 ubiquitin-protein ligase RNF4-like isoform X1 n=2 Tax=Centruroides sculpturatus TaxID=218467 RepID=UPI000C6D8BA4|nr:E3 ubiquitin-protein ligase RNF4-like isoform X1 [Centruroides sculpturatus]
MSVIQHTSMISQPITVDLCSPQTNIPSCIDLTNEQDDSEIVDLTSASPHDTSVVCLGQSSHSVDTVARLLERRAKRAHQHDHCYRVTTQHIDVDREDNQSNMSKDVFPIYDSCVKNWDEKMKNTVEDPALKKIICPICFDDISSIQKNDRHLVSTVCGHIFCNSCLQEAIRTHHCCPNCRKRLTMKQFHPIFI